MGGDDVRFPFGDNAGAGDPGGARQQASQVVNDLLWQLLAGIACGPEATCNGKVAHHSEYRANNHALSLDGVPDAHRVEPYPCPFCWNWHVGRIMKPGRTKYLARTRQSKTPHDSQEEQAT